MDCLERRLRKRFYHIKERCGNKNCKHYSRYGGRGIRCERNSVEEFITDMGELFKEHVESYGIDNTTIDRIDVNGNYCKENCRWATWEEQSKNRRECREFDYKGRHFHTLRDLAKHVGINEATIDYRLEHGWDLIRALETPVIKHNPKVERPPKKKRKKSIIYKGIEFQSVKDLSVHLGINYNTLKRRVRDGYSEEELVLGRNNLSCNNI